MVKYELMVIFKPLLPEDNREDVYTSVTKEIESKKIGGKIVETDVWGKRHLAYEIDGYDEGYYIVYKCELNPDKIADLESEFKLNNDLLRYLITKS